ncbi:MAG: Na/Pi cotransporter family protein [Lachnospiraceae bacterium]|jgi:phosphate:Na+ symporter
MTVFDGLKLIGGLSLFLFGMNVMGQALERRAGGSLQSLLGRLTTNKLAGLFTGLGITAVIQSSSATTVMVVGFVNSGLMSLKQAINVIMGANVGTTVTAWILSLAEISSDNFFVRLLKPSSFTPVLALIGIALHMFGKKSKHKDIGTVLLGFSVLMFGMDTMSGAVAGLADVPAFAEIFILFKNPIFGLLVGAVITAIIQSSSASVGILQALATTGLVNYGVAVPIIMGQNIGTCITAILSSFGTNRNAKRAAFVHLSFNIIGSVVCLALFCGANAIFAPPIFSKSASLMGIALAHSAFNIFCTCIMLPASSLLEKLVYKLVPEKAAADVIAELDERLLATPTIAVERCYNLAADMAKGSVESLKGAIACLKNYSPQLAKNVRELEEKDDHYEDIIGSYLVKLSVRQIDEKDSAEAAKLLKIIGDLERISDHARNLVASAEEMSEKDVTFSDPANEELDIMFGALDEILDLTLVAFVKNDINIAMDVEPLEQVVDVLHYELRQGHIERLQQGLCNIEAGFIWSDILTDLERASDHCSNIAGCIIDTSQNMLNVHESLRIMKTEDSHFRTKYASFAKKYLARWQAEE